MKTHKIQILTLNIVLLVILASCNSLNNEEEKIESNSNSDSLITSNILIIDTFTKPITAKPEIFLIEYSECIHNCNFESIISKKYKNDTLMIKIGTIQNCIGKFQLDLISNHDTLNLDIKIKGDIIKRKNGEIDTIISMNTCDCYYYFNIGIKNVQKEIKTILIDGHKFGRRYNDDMEIENYIPVSNAEFPGGNDSLLYFIQKNKAYPDSAYILKIEGTVYVQVIVDSNGITKNIEIIRSVSDELDLEAIRVISLIPIWIPPINENNMRIESSILIPVKFAIPKDN